MTDDPHVECALYLGYIPDEDFVASVYLLVVNEGLEFVGFVKGALTIRGPRSKIMALARFWSKHFNLDIHESVESELMN